MTGCRPVPALTTLNRGGPNWAKTDNRTKLDSAQAAKQQLDKKKPKLQGSKNYKFKLKTKRRSYLK